LHTPFHCAAQDFSGCRGKIAGQKTRKKERAVNPL